MKRSYHTLEKQGKSNARKLGENQHPVQRCRAHKLRNVMDHLPLDQKDQVKSAMRAAWRLNAKGGMVRLKKLAEWLEREYPSINRLDVPLLHRCLATTNIIENPHSGVRMRTRRVCRWRDSGMVQRWMASALLATRRISGRSWGIGISGLWTRCSMDRSLLLDGKQWRSKMASTAANFQLTSGRHREKNSSPDARL